MSELWSRENKFRVWLQIEVLVCEAWAEQGVIPAESARKIREKADFDLERIDHYDEITKHEVIAFLKAVSEHLGEEAKYLHLGLTSSDIMDTSLSFLMVEAMDVLIEDMSGIDKALTDLIERHKYQPMIGRTHGIHAEPITFGLKIAIFREEMRRNTKRLKDARENIRVGKISGAVGTYSNLNPYIEEYVCKNLSLKPARISSQIIQRDRHAQYISAIAITATTLDKLATEIRLLQQTELSEAFEPFRSGQKGSSAMPHKRNPILTENISGLSRVIRANTQVAFENMVLWHERDISHSSAERVIIVDSTTLLDFLLKRMENVLTGLEVSTEKMEENLSLSFGQVSSSRLLNSLIISGMDRDIAYDKLQDLSLKTKEGKRSLEQLALSDDEIGEFMDEDEIKACFDIDENLRYVDEILKRLDREDDLF